MTPPLIAAIVIFAAGQGSRMQSDLPKVLHPLGAVPLVLHAMRAAHEIKNAQISEGAFIGSATLLVAPMKLGAPALALGRARQEVKAGLGKRLMDRLRAAKSAKAKG